MLDAARKITALTSLRMYNHVISSLTSPIWPQKPRLPRARLVSSAPSSSDQYYNFQIQSDVLLLTLSSGSSGSCYILFRIQITFFPCSDCRAGNESTRGCRSGGPPDRGEVGQIAEHVQPGESFSPHLSAGAALLHSKKT